MEAFISVGDLNWQVFGIWMGIVAFILLTFSIVVFCLSRFPKKK